MKRPEMVAVFSPTHLGSEDLARRWLDVLLAPPGCTLNPYFAPLELDADSGEYDATDETLDLSGRSELERRISKHGGGLWSCRVPLGFANADVYSAVFSSPPRALPSQATLHLQIAPSITRFVEDQPEARAPFIAFLVKVADEIGAPWFLAGLHLRMRALSRDDFLAGGGPDTQPYVAGWKPDTLDASPLLQRWAVPPDEVQHSVLGYSVATRFPAR